MKKFILNFLILFTFVTSLMCVLLGVLIFLKGSLLTPAILLAIAVISFLALFVLNKKLTEYESNESKDTGHWVINVQHSNSTKNCSEPADNLNQSFQKFFSSPDNCANPINNTGKENNENNNSDVSNVKNNDVFVKPKNENREQQKTENKEKPSVQILSLATNASIEQAVRKGRYLQSILKRLFKYNPIREIGVNGIVFHNKEGDVFTCVLGKRIESFPYDERLISDFSVQEEPIYEDYEELSPLAYKFTYPSGGGSYPTGGRRIGTKYKLAITVRSDLLLKEWYSNPDPSTKVHDNDEKLVELASLDPVIISKISEHFSASRLGFITEEQYNKQMFRIHCSYDENEKTIKISEGVRRIEGKYLDKKVINIANVKRVILPRSLNIIGANMFENYIGLESIVIPSSVKVICVKAFSNCKNLKSVTLSDGVEGIGYRAFENCSSLESIVIPPSVKVIDGKAFSNCKNLKSVTIPDGVEKIDKEAFGQCESLESIVIPPAVKVIDEYAFGLCTSLESIVIPPSVKVIGKYAFYGCTSLESIVILSSVKVINRNAFFNCINLKSVTIPDGVEKIDKEAFGQCKSLESIVIPPSVKVIDESAFRQCENLKSVTLPDGVEKICTNAFESCTSLESIVIPPSVKVIYGNAFSNCKNLKSVTLPDSLEAIE